MDPTSQEEVHPKSSTSSSETPTESTVPTSPNTSPRSITSPGTPKAA